MTEWKSNANYLHLVYLLYNEINSDGNIATRQMDGLRIQFSPPDPSEMNVLFHPESVVCDEYGIQRQYCLGKDMSK